MIRYSSHSRGKPTKPYLLPLARLTFSSHVLTKTLAFFQEYIDLRVETCCFWYGVFEINQSAVVQALVIPNQENRWGNFHISGDAMAAVSKATRAAGWRNLGQIHSHPGKLVEHSTYDDAHVNSRQSLSLVFPHYGMIKRTWPGGVGIHEYQNGFWHLLNEGDALARVQIFSSDAEIPVIDLRWNNQR